MIHPNNFLQGAMGENNRVMQLVSIFKEMDYEIDFFSYENFSPNSTFKDFKKLNRNNIIHRLYLYDFMKGYGSHGLLKRKIDFAAQKIKYKLTNQQRRKYLQDWVPFDAKQMFRDIVSKNNYDVIICFYTYMSTMFRNMNLSAKKIYFMEDSMFLQQYSWDKDRLKGISLGKLMDEELGRMKCFDEVFCISNDERIFYEKITGKKMHFFPHLLSDDMQPVKTPLSERKWDVFFIGFNNPFNIAGLEWFIQEVYPMLNKSLKILLIGSATKQVNVKYNNIDIIPFVPDLNEIYANVKVAICPMFQGTGMKVKVVEAMAKGLPVVCTERGVDGMPDKNMCGCLVTEDAKEFAGYINKLIGNNKFYNQVSFEIIAYYKKVFNKKKYIETLEGIFS